MGFLESAVVLHVLHNGSLNNCQPFELKCPVVNGDILVTLTLTDAASQTAPQSILDSRNGTTKNSFGGKREFVGERPAIGR